MAPVLDSYRVIELGMWVGSGGGTAGGLGRRRDQGRDTCQRPMRRLFRRSRATAARVATVRPRHRRSGASSWTSPCPKAQRSSSPDPRRGRVPHNLRPEAVERLGLGPDQLLAEFPKLVYGRSAAMGSRVEVGRAGATSAHLGPLGHRADGARRHRPARGAVRHGDHITGITTVAGILAAFARRERTGEASSSGLAAARSWHLLGRVGPRHPDAVRQDRLIRPLRRR